MPLTVWAQDSPEDFQIEFTASYWWLSPSGSIRDQAAPIDLNRDLGIRERKGHFAGELVWKPAQRHRLLIAAVPYRLDGNSRLTREIEFAGRQYQVNEEIDSRTEINQIFGGYQYDMVSGRQGHVGVLGGVVFMDATAVARSTTRNISEQSSARLPIPVIGFGFRGYPLRSSSRIRAGGQIKGVTLGSYGSYIDAQIHIGLALSRSVGVQFGYAVLDADIERRDRLQSFAPFFKGPTISLQLTGR